MAKLHTTFINGHQQLSGVARHLLPAKESSSPTWREKKEWTRAMEKTGANCALRQLTNPTPKE